MKLYFFIFLLILIPSAIAVGFSPSSLTYLLEPNQEICQAITLDSESETIDVSDVWASSPEAEWKISGFNISANEHNLKLSYPKELSINERQINVCISGVEEGEYHGAIIMRQEQEGNSIIQLAVWLKIFIKEKSEESSEVKISSTSNSGGGGSSFSATVKLNQTENTQDKNYQQLSKETETSSTETPIREEELQDNNPGITGNVISIIGSHKLAFIVPITFIIIVIVASAYLRRKKQQNRLYGIE